MSAMRIAARFEVRFTAFLDAQGQPLGPLPAFAADPATLEPDYRAMVLMRALDAKAVAMQRTGQIGTYASTLGKEAIDAGIAHALAPEDVVLPSYRESGILMLRGVSPHRVFLYWGGDERGSVFPESPRDFPFNVPIASQLPHAAGVAYAMKLRGERRAALAICGDGATSKGDFYEALNAAGVWRLPMVVLVVNNQYAISVPRRMQSAAQTLAVTLRASPELPAPVSELSPWVDQEIRSRKALRSRRACSCPAWWAGAPAASAPASSTPSASNVPDSTS